MFKELKYYLSSNISILLFKMATELLGHKYASIPTGTIKKLLNH